MKQKKEERPVISFRVNKSLKDKIIEVYGDFTPLENIIAEAMFGEKIEYPAIKNYNYKVKHLENIIKEYTTIYQSNINRLKKIEDENKQLTNKINGLQTQIIAIKTKNKEIKHNIEYAKIQNQERIDHSVKVVTGILEENQKQRELRPTKRINKSVIKLYSDNCNMSLQKFMDYIPPELHKCVE